MQNQNGINMIASPKNITELKPNEIFVFGSNEAGMHGAGAAKQAKRFGAKMGVGNGIQGNTYGIPTKNKRIETLSISRISKYVNEFIEYAIANPNLIFLVTPIGCGLAGYNATDIAPLFLNALTVENIHLPEIFIRELHV